MTILIAGLLVFFVPHLFSSFRTRAEGADLRQSMGQLPYMGLYSLVSLVGFVLIVWGYGAARPSEVLYTAPTWGRHLNYLLMPIALVILVASQVPKGYIAKTLKHPMLVAVKIWAVGHLLANGELNSVLLFGAFLAYAVIDRIAVKRRGDLGAVAQPNVMGDVISVVVGLGAFVALLLWLHPVLFGVPVWPPA
ncbi:MAG: NnrU family protein [Pseudomonadota bacterium]